MPISTAAISGCPCLLTGHHCRCEIVFCFRHKRFSYRTCVRIIQGVTILDRTICRTVAAQPSILQGCCLTIYWVVVPLKGEKIQDAYFLKEQLKFILPMYLFAACLYDVSKNAKKLYLLALWFVNVRIALTILSGLEMPSSNIFVSLDWTMAIV